MRILASLLLLGAAWPALALDLDDPLASEAALRLQPTFALSARVGEAPCATALPATALTLAEAVDLALCRHPQTREVWAAARAQAALLGVARSDLLPGVDGRLGVTRSFSGDSSQTQQSAALTLSWLLFDFGQRSAQIDNASQLLDAALASRDATLQSLFLAALRAYYTALATQAAVLAAGEAEQAAQASLAAAELRYRVGAATPADRLQAQTAASQARLNRIRAEGEASNARGALANALGLPAQTALRLADLPPAPAVAEFRKDVEAMIAAAQQRRPDLLAAEAQLRAAEASVVAAQAQGRPSLTLSAGPTWQQIQGSSSDGGSLGVTLTIPLFSGFATTYRVRSAQAQVAVRQAQRERLANQVALDVWQAYQGARTATDSLQASGDLLASAGQSERVARGRYQAGVGSVLDLLTAQSALANARVQRIQAELDWNVSRATLAQAMGALDQSLLQAAEGKP